MYNCTYFVLPIKTDKKVVNGIFTAHIYTFRNQKITFLKQSRYKNICLGAPGGSVS